MCGSTEQASWTGAESPTYGKLCIQRPNPALTMAHTKLIEKYPAVYPYMTSSMKIASIAQGEFSISADDMFQGEVPSKLILGLVSSSAYIGDYKKSPFNFGHYDCNFVALYVDGQSLPGKPLQPQFGDKNYMNAYLTQWTISRSNTHWENTEWR